MRSAVLALLLLGFLPVPSLFHGPGPARSMLPRATAATPVVPPAPPESGTSTGPSNRPSPDAPRVLLLVGAAGEEEFGSNFVAQAALWKGVTTQAGAALTVVGLDPAPPTPHTNDLTHFLAVLDAEAAEPRRDLWIVLVGHGTFDGKEARFNLRGPDLTASDLADHLKPIHRPVAVLNTASASAPFLNKLSASNRVIVTATRSGFEQNFTRFGRHLAEAIADPSGDLDQDGQTSLLEAFLSASFRVAEFYKTEGRMATEHALIDDNGDSLGTPSEWFRGLRAVKKAKDGAALDGVRAHQFHLIRSSDDAHLTPEARSRRDVLEREIATLRESRPAQPDDAWYNRLEPLVLELARLYRTNAPAAPPR